MIPRTDDRWIELFLDAKTAEQGLAHNSQLAYLRDLAGFKAFLVPARTTFDAVTQSDIEAYLIDCDIACEIIYEYTPLIKFPI